MRGLNFKNAPVSDPGYVVYNIYGKTLSFNYTYALFPAITLYELVVEVSVVRRSTTQKVHHSEVH